MVTKAKKPVKEEVEEIMEESTAEKKSRARVAPKSGRTAVDIWNELFTKNFRSKLTDEELQAAYEAEMGRPLGQPVPRLRSYFNNGKYGLGEGEDVKLDKDDRSVGYDKDGNKLTSTRGRKAADSKETSKKAKAAKAEVEEDDAEEEEEEVPRRKRRTQS
jgi:hypothetical protein